MVKIINQSFEIVTKIDGLRILKEMEIAARTCYKSEDKITEDGSSAKKLITMLMSFDPPHEPMIEFGNSVHVKIICNRGLSHELVRHRLAGFAQESTRYVNYSLDKHDNEITVVFPLIFRDNMKVEKRKYSFEDPKIGSQFAYWILAMKQCETSYLAMIKHGAKPQIARGVLPIDVKTEINIIANLREWRRIFLLRTSERAHPQIREIMRGILMEFKKQIPVIFDDFPDYELKIHANFNLNEVK